MSSKDLADLEKYKHQIDIWRRAYNISREKIILFHDFLISLNDLMDKTYLGVDFMDLEEDQKGHFNWCWDKTIEAFSKERIHFKNRGVCYDYMWLFFLDAFYITKLNGSEVKIKGYFEVLFDFKYIKTRSELDIFTEVYRMFEQNLKK